MTYVYIHTGALKVLRISRLLRPLRALRNLRALTILSNALLHAAYPLLVTTCIILMMVTGVAALNMQVCNFICLYIYLYIYVCIYMYLLNDLFVYVCTCL